MTRQSGCGYGAGFDLNLGNGAGYIFVDGKRWSFLVKQFVGWTTLTRKRSGKRFSHTKKKYG